MTPSFYHRFGQRVLAFLKNSTWLKKYHRFDASVMLDNIAAPAPVAIGKINQTNPEVGRGIDSVIII